MGFDMNHQADRGRAGSNLTRPPGYFQATPQNDCAGKGSDGYPVKGGNMSQSALADSASFCAKHGLETQLDSLCSQAVMGLSSGYLHSHDALRVAESALTLYRSPPYSEQRGSAKQGANNLFTTLHGIATLVPVSLRMADLKLLADVLLQWAILKQHEGESFDILAPYSGLAAAAAPMLGQGIPEEEVLSMVYALTQGLGLLPSLEQPDCKAIEEALRIGFVKLRARVHKLCAKQIMDFTTAVSTAWMRVSATLQDTVLKNCLFDIGQAVRFRRAAFSETDLVSMVVAMGDADVKDDTLADVLLRRLSSGGKAIADGELALLALTCLRSSWLSHPLCTEVANLLAARDLTTFSSQDLCSAANFAASLRDSGVNNEAADLIIQNVCAEVQDRDASRLEFEHAIKILGYLATPSTDLCGVCSVLVNKIMEGEWVQLRQDLATSILNSMAKLWTKLHDFLRQESMLVARTLRATSWEFTNSTDALRLVCSLAKLPIDPSETGIQDSISRVICCMDALSVSNEQLSNILLVLWKCGSHNAIRMAAPTSEPFTTEAKSRLKQLKTVLAGDESDADLMLAETDQAEAEALKVLAEVVKKVETERDDDPPDGYSDTDSEGDSYNAGRRRKKLGRQVSYTGSYSTHGLPAQMPRCTDESCCPTAPQSDGDAIRINRHCNFSGHCVQVKNTFIHIQCDEGIGSDPEHDCPICRRTRARSCDLTERAFEGLEANMPTD